MLYLKNTLGGLSRSLTDSALNSFQGPHRWWKLALFAGLFVLPGGSLGVAILAWFEHRRGKGDKTAVLEGAAESALADGITAAPNHAAAHAGPCQARGDTACRAAAGKLARKTTCTDTRG
ncbi:hypothetical protein [Paraburkholderia sp. DGU8]|jgi:hypothetical protein|uniref:hypothetical protein n=1 Tax=Paraburkholderia sp. DGU8 TaxID=3161997 RepID=UPI003465E909